MEVKNIIQLSDLAAMDDRIRTEVQGHLWRRTMEWLKEFGLDEGELFLDLLATNRAYIGGRSVMDVAFPKQTTKGGKFQDMVILCPRGESGNVATVIRSYRNYRKIDSTAKHLKSVENPPAGAASITSFYNIASHRTIRLIESSTPYAIQLLFHAPSTVDMTVIDKQGVLCFYPDLSSERKGIVNHATTTPKDYGTMFALWECRTAGFSIGDSLTTAMGGSRHECGKHPECSQTIRTMDDGHSIFVPFPGERVYLKDMDRLIWRLDGSRCEGSRSDYKGFTIADGFVYTEHL
jgi:hypothetical protein